MNLSAALEGLLFISGDEGLDQTQITKILEIDENQLNKTIQNLNQEYSKDNRGIILKKFGKKLKMVTKPQYANYYKKIYEDPNANNLSPAALETLAIIAYNEPITRMTIDEIRGINSTYLIKKLVFQNLIKEIGRSELPGRPVLYGVTDQFLDYFGLKSLDELPKINIEDQKSEEIDLFQSKYKEKI
jgi:segregation and condensation protein B